MACIVPLGAQRAILRELVAYLVLVSVGNAAAPVSTGSQWTAVGESFELLGLSAVFAQSLVHQECGEVLACKAR